MRFAFIRECARWACAVAVGVAVTAARGDAQARWVPRVQLDNDVYNFWRRHTQRPDEEYTNGVRVAFETQRAPWWGRRLGGGRPDCASREVVSGSCLTSAFLIGQELYTPKLDRAPHLVPDWQDERPFFAWLYVGASARTVSERDLRTVDVALGVTGPPALGQLAQTVAHRIGFNREATGWETQIGFEPGVVLQYRHDLLALRLGGHERLGVELAPYAAATLGNVRTTAEGGGTARLGWNLSHPWLPRSWVGRPDTEAWVSAGGHVEQVARNMALDGTLRNPSRFVERINRVSQYEFGAGVRVQVVTVAWRAVTRSREYRTGPSRHTYSTMVAGFELVP
jgi:hypothetical protein